MAYELVAEVLDHAPDGMDAACRMILVCIAEQCRRPRAELAPARVHQFPAELMRRRTGLDERGLRHALNRLKERHGMDVRVALKLDRGGAPVYALPGKPCTWVLPPLPVPPGCECQRCSEQADLPVLLPDEEDLGVREGGPTSPEGGPTSPAGGLTGPPPQAMPETGGVAAAADPGQEPPRRCRRHLKSSHPPACGACGDARRTHEAWETARQTWDHQQAERARTAPRCAQTGHGSFYANNCGACRFEHLDDQKRGQPVVLNGRPLEVGDQITATVDATGAAVTVTRTAARQWRVAATKLGAVIYEPTTHPDETAARTLARSYCEELRQIRAGRKLTQSPITVTRQSAVASG